MSYTANLRVNNNDNIFILTGNKRLLPVFVGSGPVSKRARREDCVLETNDEETTPEGIVMYKGSLLDVEKLVSQLKRSEKARLDTEDRMMELQHELTVVNEKSTKQTNSIKSLSDDLKTYKDKLRGTEEKLKKTSVSILTFVYYLLVLSSTNVEIVFSDIRYRRNAIITLLD